jgi:FkbM family methyltransferase
MIISLDFLVQKYNILFTGILHVGAHECEEIVFYDKYLPRNKVLWVDALQDKVDFCRATYPDVIIEQAVVSDCVEAVVFNRSNNGQSSSFLDFGIHEIHYPDVQYVDSFETNTKMLKDIICNYDISFNFLNFDIQGVELKALKGMGDYLKTVDYIYTEVNRKELYANIPLIREIDEYLQVFGFVRKITYWVPYEGWGDALYVRQNFNQNITFGQKVNIFFTQIIFKASYLNYHLLHRYLKRQFYLLINYFSGPVTH